MEDPNWFFSTLAQSAAAIVGLIGAFLVSRIVEQANEVREKKRELFREVTNQEIIQAKNDLEKFKDSYLSEKNRLEIQTKKKNKVPLIMLESNINIGITLENSESILNHLSDGGVLFKDREDFLTKVEANRDVIFEQSIEFYEKVHEHLNQWGNSSIKGDGIVYDVNIRKLFDNIIKLDDKFRMIKREQQYYVSSFVLPDYFKNGLRILTYLAFLCVWLPLFFLYARQECIKNILWIAFLIGLIFLMIYFNNQINLIDRFVKAGLRKEN